MQEFYDLPVPISTIDPEIYGCFEKMAAMVQRGEMPREVYMRCLEENNERERRYREKLRIEQVKRTEG